mgnify:FL=1
MQNRPQKENPGENAVKDARKQITRSILLALTALAVIAFACYAWFVSTKRVTGSIRPVQLLGSTFELASAGTSGAYDHMLPDGLNISGDSWNPSGTVTSTGRASILWQVSDSSNLNNTEETGCIQPGSRGAIQFSVIPKADGELKLNFQIELLPMKEKGGKLEIPENNETLNNLLKGHFLFQYSTDETNSSWVPCSTGQFSLTFTDCTADTPIPVTLNWRWPYLLKLVTDQPEVVNWMKEDTRYFFYNHGNTVEAPTELTPNAENFAQYDRYYNNADEYIGENAYGVLLRLTAEAV